VVVVLIRESAKPEKEESWKARKQKKAHVKSISYDIYEVY